MKLFLAVIFCTKSLYALAQDAGKDTIPVLPDVVIQAYDNHRKLIEVPAAISLIHHRDLNRYNQSTVVEAMNVVPGVRMDERSPGSYRFNIRGSSLRSPFGVRNVKVYYNGIPYTDPGGNTYLNQLGFHNIYSVELIKGPAGSGYGSGTGGVLLLSGTPTVWRPGLELSYTAGSYGMQNVHAAFTSGFDTMRQTVRYQRQQSDGYREHTAMHRDVVSWDMKLARGATDVTAHFLFGDLYYQTPGALTLAEYKQNPASARPAAGASPSAEQAQAAYRSNTVLTGISLHQQIARRWNHTTTVYAAYSQNRNPNFRNYSRTSEPHFGGRTVFQWNDSLPGAAITINAGGEFQQSYNTQRVYKNAGGSPGDLQTDDELFNTQGFVFLQANAELHGGWIFTAGASINESVMHFERLSGAQSQNEKRNFKNQIAPRLALLKKLSNTISLYGNVAKGFSPPGTSELLPSTDIWNTKLEAETGTNYELGMRAGALKNRLYIDMNAYYYRLQNAIIQKRDASGGDYFDNAGSANQFGLEAFVNYQFINNTFQFFNFGNAYVSTTTNAFKYDHYMSGSNDYSGNKMPGVAPQTVAAGADMQTRAGFYGLITFFHSGKIMLNDANTASADSYNLLGAKVGWKKQVTARHLLNVYGGVQNALNETYSLGNDINAFGGRYYNAAPLRNFYVGISWQFYK